MRFIMLAITFLTHRPQLHGFQFDNQATWQGVDPNKTTMNEVYSKFGLDENTADFTGTSTNQMFTGC